jgi:hypothetical protein
MKFTAIILTLLMILSGLGLISISAEETSDPEGNPITISTDKETYYKGEPIKIKISGKNAWTSTYRERGYSITDEKGYWVRDPPYVTTFDVLIIEGDVYYTWDQKYDFISEYDLEGNPRVHYNESGEQVSNGRYYIHFLLDMDVFVDIEIVDRYPRNSNSITVTTDSYFYDIGEIISIKMEGTYSSLSSEIALIDYIIEDINGNYVIEPQMVLLLCGNEPWLTWKGLKYYQWNQTFLIYNRPYRNLYNIEGSTLVPPSGEQVPPGRYYVYASLNGRKISEPSEFEIVNQKNLDNEKEITNSFSATKIPIYVSDQYESTTILIIFGYLVSLIMINVGKPSKRFLFSIL